MMWSKAWLVAGAIGLLLAKGAVAQPTQGSPVVSPEVKGDGSATLRLLAPNAREVGVMGDFVTAVTPLTKGDGGIWTYTSPVLKPGIYGYYFRVDSVRVPDPGNLSISSGATFLKSYLEVPGDTPQFWAVKDVPHGDLHEHFYLSPELKTTRRVIAYTPPGYDPTQTYPVLYLFHGAGDNETFWTRVGRSNFIMDNLLAEKACKPAILVSCFGHTSTPPGDEGGARGIELYEVSKIEKELTGNVLPLISSRYRVGQEPGQRAIAGLSMGGYQALTIGGNNPELFGYVADFSGGFRANQNLEENFQRLLSRPAAQKNAFKLLQIRCGSTEGGVVTANKRVADFFTSNGINHEYQVIDQGTHTWLSWRESLKALLPRLF